MFVRRTIEKVILQVSDTFPILLITGPRQVGKTTLLKSCAAENRRYVSLDELEQRTLAKNDPALFLQKHKPPVIIDEIQYAPELLPYIKILVDEAGGSGLFWLTGSQKFHLMRGISESLAGRVAILDLLGLSQLEAAGLADLSKPFISAREHSQYNDGMDDILKSDLQTIYQRIWRGSFPKLIANPEVSRDIFYNSYMQTYIQRDVKDILNISDETQFFNFVRAAAARTGQTLNYSNIANELDVDVKTVRSWLSILETSGLIYLLPPYHNNLLKRIIKSPKLYFLDTGLCSFLSKWPTYEALEAGSMSGAILETYAVSEIIKSYWHNGAIGNIYYYRDTDKKEIDILIESGDTIYPIEVKKNANPSKDAIKSFKVLDNLNKKVGQGTVLCLRDNQFPLTREVDLFPIGRL